MTDAVVAVIGHAGIHAGRHAFGFANVQADIVNTGWSTGSGGFDRALIGACGIKTSCRTRRRQLESVQGWIKDISVRGERECGNYAFSAGCIVYADPAGWSRQAFIGAGIESEPVGA